MLYIEIGDWFPCIFLVCLRISWHFTQPATRFVSDSGASASTKALSSLSPPVALSIGASGGILPWKIRWKILTQEESEFDMILMIPKLGYMMFNL